MNFLDDEDFSTNQPPIDEPYKLANENTVLGEFVNDINKESTKVSDEIYSHEIIPEIDPILEPTPPGEQKRAKTTAEFVVKTADQLISKLLGAYAKTDGEKFEADKADINEIAGYFAPYFTGGNFDLPPWVMGAIVAGFVLFDKFKLANELKKINTELETKNERLKEAELKNIELEAKVKYLGLLKTEKELQKKVENLESEVA